MNYEIWLLDGFNEVKLDTEDLDIATTFSIADVADIALRKDAITKTISIKGTKTNNQAFGSMFHGNKVTDIENILDKIGFNYNSLRAVDCWVYENSMLLFRGSMRILEITVTKNNEVYYSVIITGKFIDFKTIIQDRKLQDLDFSDLAHTYSLENIIKSWGSPTYSGNVVFTASHNLVLSGNTQDIEPYVLIGMEFAITGTVSNNGLFSINSFSDPDNFNSVQNVISETAPSATITFNPSFQKGKGYVYPYIDYGILYRSTSTYFADYEISSESTPPGNWVNPEKINVLNFKPAVYVREYINRIFQQLHWIQNTDSLGFPIPGDYKPASKIPHSPYTYEVLGDDDFQAKFNSLIIPYAGDNTTPIVGRYTTFKNTTPLQTQSGVDVTDDTQFIDAHIIGRELINIPDDTQPIGTASYIGLYSTYDNILIVKRTFTADANISVSMHIAISSLWPIDEIKVQLVQRNEATDQHANDGANWVSVAESQSISLAPGTPDDIYKFNFTAGARTYQQHQQLALRLWWYAEQYTSVPQIGITFTIDSAEIDFPKNATTSFSLDYDYDARDTIFPVAPENVTQMDFLKSFLNLFNIYVYSKTGYETNLIFEKYDDYYAFTGKDIIMPNGSHKSIKDFALNWTEKIDYSAGYKITPNVKIPKSYLFTYKDDNDYANADYKKTFLQTYGTFILTDSLGIGDQKKVALIFSPTPLILYVGADRIFPALYSGLPDTTRKPLKTNIRILYYNGLQVCNPWSAADENFTGIIDLRTFSYYPNCSTYYYDPATHKPVNDLNFGRPKAWYFPATVDFINASTAYNEFYINQISELTNPNIFQVACSAYMNEVDINQMDLRTPLFIDMANNGQLYFKILSVEYENYFTPASIVLQKIFLTEGSREFIEFFTISLDGFAVPIYQLDPPSTTDGYLVTAHSGADVYVTFHLPYNASVPVFTDMYNVPAGLTINSANEVEGQWYIIIHYPAAIITPFHFTTL